MTGKNATERLLADEARIARAAAILEAGGLVAVPTETVYGLAARADSADAVARIYAAKGRPDFNPLIVHVRDTRQAARYGELSETALHLAALVSDATLRSWRPAALLEEGGLGDAHWDGHETAMRQIADWLVDPRRRDRLFDAFLAAETDSPQAIVLAEAHDEIDRILAARAQAADV